jgi:transposase
MRTYSADLRQRIVAASQSQGQSQRVIARRFFVSLAFVHKLLRQYREEGHIKPKAHGGGHKPLLDKHDLEVIGRLIEKHRGASLDHLCEAVEEKCRVKISRSTMCRVRQKLRAEAGSKAANNKTPDRLSFAGPTDRAPTRP